jgi:hypothetical protein
VAASEPHRGPDAPNGTAELLVDSAMRGAALEPEDRANRW